MDLEFASRTFRIFRELYECAIDDLLLTHKAEFRFCHLKWEKLPPQQENNELILHLTYQGENVLLWELRSTTLEYNWKRRHRLN